jgi:tRNA dimethylallyltransferase
MLMEPFESALVLTGPTGSGKSELGVELAERLGAEIVSMDSMALYRGMDIGTAKPDLAARRRVRHHLIDVRDPWESANVAWWLQEAAACCRDIARRGKRVLFVGGTALYLKALIFGIFEGPPADAEVRLRLESEAAAHGAEALHMRLAQVDPASAARLHPNNMRRIVRALEVWELTGRPISSWQTQWRKAGIQHSVLNTQCSVLWLNLPRPELYARIDARVDRMLASGLIEEVRALRQFARPLSKEASQALGYKELFANLDGTVSLEEAAQRIRTRSRNFAKRQVTWFRHLPGCRPVTRELTFDLWGLRIKG